MKLRVPFVYYAEITPKKARNSRKAMFGEYVDAEIREVADFDAPVALRWAADKYGQKGLGGFNERRWFDGRLWEPSIYYYSGRPNEHIDAAGLEEATRRGYRHSALIHNYDHQVSQLIDGKVAALDPAECREVLSSERDRELRKTMDLIEGVLIVDGKVWKESAEPVYRVSDSGGFQRYIRLEVIEPPTELRQQEGVFRIDRFDDLVAYAREKFGEEFDDENRVDVLIPEAVGYDDEYPSLLAGLKETVDRQQSEIGSRETVEIVAWAGMRDAVRDMEAAPDPETIEAAIQAAEAWLETTVASKYWREAAVTAIGRWNVRPILMSAEEEDVSSFRP